MMSSRWTLVLLLLLVGCSDESSESLQDIEYSGQVVKGPIRSAAVRVYALATDAGAGRLLSGPLETDAQGQFSGVLRGTEGGPFVWQSIGGSFVDEVSGATVDLVDLELYGYSRGGAVVVTPFSAALYQAAGATAQLLEISAQEAWQRVGEAFDAAFGLDPWTTVPDAGGELGQKRFAALLGGICELIDSDTQLASVGSVEPVEFHRAIVEDLADGRLNGVNVRGEPLFVQSATGPVLFPALDPAGIDPLVDAANRYADSVPALEAVTFDAVSLDIYPARTGTGGGLVTFSGEGLTNLPAEQFEPNLFALEFYALIWESAITGVRIEVVPSPTKPELATTVRVLYGTHSWLAQDAFDVNGVSGVTLDGTTVRFQGVMLAGTIVTTTELQLDGTLTADP